MTARRGSIVRFAWPGPGSTVRPSSVSTRPPVLRPTATRSMPSRPGHSPRFCARDRGAGEPLRRSSLRTARFPGTPEQTTSLCSLFPESGGFPPPVDPTRSEMPPGDIEVLEWLDRPFPRQSVRGENDLPRVLATIYITPRTSGSQPPSRDTRNRRGEAAADAGAEAQPLERWPRPCPCPFWTPMSGPPGFPETIDRDLAHRLSPRSARILLRDQWITFRGRVWTAFPPLAASLDARRGDAVARAKLAAVIQVTRTAWQP